jgi:hypothetical protein
MSDEASSPEDRGAPVRVVTLSIPDRELSEALLGPGTHAPRCQVIFRYMLPAPEEATLKAVLPHGLVLAFEPSDEVSPKGLLVPWPQVSYVRLLDGEKT